MPPKPKALTPAIRRCAGTAQGRASSSKEKGLVSARQAGLGVSMCRVGGRTPVWTARAALISPASPAAHLVCPSCDFTEPSAQAPGSAPDAVNSSLSTASSVLSPTTVPVPCASIRPTSSGPMPDFRA